jgi:hypothetical protein
VVRLGFKPSRGRQTLSGRFDSCCLPPVKAPGESRTLVEELRKLPFGS